MSRHEGLRIHHGLCDHGPDIDPRAADAVARYATTDDKVMEIVRELGVSTATFYNWLSHFGQRRRQPPRRSD